MNYFYLRFVSVLSVLLIVFLFFSSASFVSISPDASLGDTIKVGDYYLEMKGTVRESKGTLKDEVFPMDSAMITIYLGEIPYSEILTNKKGRCTFKLPLDKVFKISVSKKGFVTKYFEVITKVPFDKKDVYSFSFDIDIFEDIKGLDVTVLKKPVAKVSFNQVMEQFAYDVNYTSKINNELKKMYKNYYLLQQIGADTSLYKTEPKANGEIK